MTTRSRSEPGSQLSAIGTVLAGTTTSQAIPVIASLALTRLYSPASFGAFAAWLSLVTIAAVLSTARLEASLAMFDDGVARSHALRATFTTLALGAVTISLLVAVASTIFDWLPVVPAALLALLPAGTLLVAASQTLISNSAAGGRFRALSTQRIAQAGTIAATQIAAGLYSPSPLTLSIGHVLGTLCGVAIAMRTLRTPSGAESLSLNLAAMRSHWRMNWRFPMFAVPSDLVNAASAQLPLLLIAARFGDAAGGAYALAYRTLGLPLAVVGSAVLDVFKQRAGAQFRSEGNCRAEYGRTFRLLAPAAVFVAVGGFFVAEPAIVFAFGSDWREAGRLARWLTPLFALRIVASPLSYVFYLARAQHLDLVWQSVLLAATWVTLSSGASLRSAVTAYAVAYASLYAVYLLLSYRLSLGTLHRAVTPTSGH